MAQVQCNTRRIQYFMFLSRKHYWDLIFLNNGYLKEISTHPKDVGYIPCFLNILFLVVAYLKLLKSFFNKDICSVLLSCMILYFFLHSMKIAMVSYSLSFFIFIIFLLQIITSKTYVLHAND